MSVFKVQKVIGSVPEIIEPDCVYLVRTGAGFDIYVSDTTGGVAHILNGGAGASINDLLSIPLAEPGDVDHFIAIQNGELRRADVPTGSGEADTDEIMASEDLEAGDFVNIWNDGGIAKVRKASANTEGKRAHAFVLVPVSSGAVATIYYEGPNTALSGLTPGSTYFLNSTNPGKVTSSTGLSLESGHIVQELGVAISATKINVEISKPIARA